MSADIQTAPGTRTAPGSTKLIWTGRVISTLLTLMLLLDGVMKLLKPPQVLEACAALGLPESTIAGIGIALVARVVLYAIPATAALGAILLTGYLGGAVMAHVRVEDPPWKIAMPIVFGGLVWLGLFLRDQRLRALVPIRRSLP
jgi:hypothetical protein